MKRLALSAILVAFTACDQANSGGAMPMPVDPSKPADTSAEPQHIAVQHVLISFKGTRTSATRSKEEAQVLAKNVLSWAQSGMAMEELMKKYSDDPGGGTYKMANKGVQKGQGEFDRMGMVPAFGNVGFKLKVGEIGMSEFHPTDSPYGWHIIKRIE